MDSSLTSPLEKLPPETLGNITSFIGSGSLFSLRLVNKYISTATDFIFFPRYFQRRKVFIGTDSLGQLLDISRSTKCRASVTELVVYVHHVLETSYKKGWARRRELYLPLMGLSSPESEMVISNDPVYAKLLEDQKWLMESGQATASLASALGKFSNCVVVGITDRLHDLDKYNFMESQASQFLTTTMKVPGSRDFFKQLISVTIAATSVSTRMLKAFVIGHSNRGINIQSLPDISPSRLGHNFSMLQSLDLTLSLENVDVRSNWEIRLFNFLKAFPLLQDLYLQFKPSLTEGQFSSIAQGLPFNGLTRLGLKGIDCNYNDLVALLIHHRDTLRVIKLDIQLCGLPRSWHRPDGIWRLIRDIKLDNDLYCTENIPINLVLGDGGKCHLLKGQITIHTKQSTEGHKLVRRWLRTYT